MTLRNDLENLKLKDLIKKHDDYEFPLFLRLVRKTLGITRIKVAELLGISETRMYTIEGGKFKRGPDNEFVITLAHFYNLDGKMLLKKYQQYQQDVQKARQDEAK